MVVHLFLNNNKALDFLPINSIKNGGITLEYKWLTVAAKNGYPVAQSNLAEVLLANDEKEKAIFWAKKAHENGAKLSNDLLNVIK